MNKLTTQTRARGNRLILTVFLYLSITGAPHSAETNFLIIKSFGNPDQAAYQPNGPLIEGSDGRLYGASWAGGKSGLGALFRLNKDGTEFRVIHHFSRSDGAYVRGEVIEGGDGKLYGTTAESQGSYGTVFAVEKDGTGFQVLHRFSWSTNDGYQPLTGVIEASDGLLYGLTQSGGAFRQGTVFRIAKDGTSYGLVASLRGLDGFIGLNVAGLIENHDGYLYGTTPQAGASNAGTIFRVAKNGTDFRIIYSFEGGINGALPTGRLVATTDGILYGTTRSGCVYRVRIDGTDYVVLKRFDATTFEGAAPLGLIQRSDGLLCGTLDATEAVLGPDGWTRSHYGALFRIDTNGQNFVLLHTFASTNGAFPAYPPTQASDGLFYGTTRAGGEVTGFDRGFGVLYRIRADGSDFEVIEFIDSTGGDGTRPTRLIRGVDGLLYGATSEGGRTNTGGTVFRLSPDGTGYSQIFAFGAIGSREPTDLIEGRDGSLYATTYFGGGPDGRGVLLRIPKDGSNATILRTFTGGSDGSYPQALVHGADGRLYGTVQDGRPNALALIFSIRTDGSDYRVVRNFVFADDYPEKLLEGSDGWLYGIGSRYSRGKIFKLHPGSSQFTILHHFGLSTNDGTYPANLFEAKDGLLYGSTGSGGTHNGGTLFKISKDGESYERFFNFPGGSNRIAIAGLVEGADSLLYGVSRNGGIYGAGVTFRVARDGGRYSILRHLASDLALPTSLVEGPDLAMYFATYGGGDMNIGAIARFIPLPDIEISMTGNVVNLLASGLPTRQLRIEASPDSANWMPLGSPSVTGRVLTDDTNALTGNRFYRAVLE